MDRDEPNQPTSALGSAIPVDRFCRDAVDALLYGPLTGSAVTVEYQAQMVSVLRQRPYLVERVRLLADELSPAPLPEPEEVVVVSRVDRDLDSDGPAGDDVLQAARSARVGRYRAIAAAAEKCVAAAQAGNPGTADEWALVVQRLYSSPSGL